MKTKISLILALASLVALVATNRVHAQESPCLTGGFRARGNRIMWAAQCRETVTGFAVYVGPKQVVVVPVSTRGRYLVEVFPCTFNTNMKLRALPSLELLAETTCQPEWMVAMPIVSKPASSQVSDPPQP